MNTPPSASPPAVAPDALAGVPSTPTVPLITGQMVPIIPQPLTYTRKVLIAVGVAAVAILLAMLVYAIADILILCFAGILLAVFLSAPSDLLAKYARIKRAYALLIVLAVLAVIVFGGGYLMGRTVYLQAKQIYSTTVQSMAHFDKELKELVPFETNHAATEPAATLPSTLRVDAATAPVASTLSASTQKVQLDPAWVWVTERLIQMRSSVTEFLLSESFVRRAGGVAGNVVSSTFGIIGNVVIVFGVGLFFAINPGLYAQGAIKLLPPTHRARTGHILAEVGTQLQWWFVGQLCSMASIGLLTTIGLWVLGVPMALTLGILAGLMNFIPNFGPILAAAPAVLIAFAPQPGEQTVHVGLAGWVILMYLVIQMLEGWVITPFFQQRAVELPPALIIISQVVFAILLGPLGLVLATPILATVLVLVRMLYVEDVLGDRAPEPSGG